jgi:hypothetical protein
MYDDDLKIGRRWAIAVGLGNLGMAAVWAYRHDWVEMIAGVFWVVNCSLWVTMLRHQQKTRDMGRLIEAGVHAMQRAIESEEL